MRPLAVALVLLTLLSTAAQPPRAAGTYAALKQQAEAAYAEKSFGRAHETYAQASQVAPPDEQRWVAMRLADTSWRMDAANPVADDTQRQTAQRALEGLIRDSGDDHDRIWAEANESLGDYWWTHPRLRNLSVAQPWYIAALDWWAGSADLPLARRRYLAIVFRMAEQPDQGYHVWQMASYIPRDVLQNAVAIAEAPEDRAHARYLLATVLINTGPAGTERALELLGEIIGQGKATPWYDDALFMAASQLADRGAVVVREDGETAIQPDCAKALELYRRIVNEYKRGETRYYDQASSAIDHIVSPSVSVMVSGTFLPRSEQEIVLAWRNVNAVEVRIAVVDLVRDADASKRGVQWIDFLPISAGVRSWIFQTNDRGDHVPGTERIRLKPNLEPGAYVVQASAGGRQSRQLLLVTDANIVVHQSGGRADLLVNDVLTGEPIAGSRIRVWPQPYSSNKPLGSIDLTTDSSGLSTIQFAEGEAGTISVFASTPRGRQAYWSSSYYPSRAAYDEWRLYAFTDRPAYRPGETVRWKFIARTRQRDQWRTPAGETIEYDIMSPRGEKAATGKATLNQFGSFWSDLPLTASMALGQYTIQFRRNSRETLGSAPLFRLEEYKLPEFRVGVTTPDKKQFRLGETIEVAIDASYYFGGPVANAGVEAVIYTRPFVRYWSDVRERYPWYFQNPDYGFGQELKRETLKTDANGKAILRIATSVDSPDTIFNIDARVTDASRREVSGSGSIRVTRQRYAVMAHPEHYLFRPGDKVGIEFKAADANDQPVQTTGTVKVVRRRWDEVWIDPAGREVSGLELDRLRSAATPPRERGRWRQTFAGYREEDVLTTKLTTDAQGEATLRFDAPDAGYYAVRWTSEDRDPGRPPRARDVVTAETTVWVTRSATMDIGYHAGGVEIIADKDAFRSGRSAPIMIVTPASGRWVMLTTSGDSILNTQVLHVDGTVKLVEIALDDRHVPSFYLTASSVFDRMLGSTSKQIIVPPVEHFIDVGVTPDRAEYEPRQEGTVTITTRDVDGKPVSAEVAVSVFDESVTAIQSDPAGDPRAFFFGAMRAAPVQVTASVQMQRYLMLMDEDGTLIDDRELADRSRREAGLGKDETNQVEYKQKRGAVGGIAAAPAAVSEAITVTAQSKVLDAAAGGKENIGTQIQVRSDFRSTAFWQPDVATGPDGTATVKVKLPEALTTWRATARAVTTGSMVGMGSATTRTNMPLIVRLQAPRFFVAGDRATISAVINNNTDAAMRVAPSLEVEGLALRSNATAADVNVPPHGESRADWIVVAERPGTAKLRVTGRAAGRGDAMEKTFTVYPHGIDKLVARSGKLRAEEAIVKLDLPRDRRETALTVQIQPSLAVTMLDALPYLIDYPYGCTEQTMSRFLPAAIVARTLAQNGLDVSDIEGRIFGGIERRFASQTHPKGAKNLQLLGAMTDASMARLYDFQHADGGWGWWKDGDSDDFMSAYVVWGFSVAKESGMPVRDSAIENAIRYLDRRLVKHENLWEMQAWMLHAIGAWRAAGGNRSVSPEERRAFDNVWGHRERLTAYSRALLALAAHGFGDAERAAVMVRNLEDGVKIDRTPDKSILLRGSGSGAAEVMATAHWGEDRTWWRWYDGPVESTAFALQALVRIDPKNKLIEPAMNWLVKNRRGAQWNNTRDTAIALLALTDYLRASGELKGDLGYELSVNGRVVATKQVSAADVVAAPSRFSIDENLVRDANEIRIRRTSGRADAPIYFAVEGRFVSLEEPVTAAGNEIFVRRDYFRLAPQPTLLKGVTYDREPLRDQGMVNSGERVDVVVTIETKNDYDYLMLEDLKPAGLEAVALQSGSPLYATELEAPAVVRKVAAGEPPAEKPTVVRRSEAADQTGRSVWVYQELRDRNVALFIDHLPQGTWEIRYTLRAEVPGAFHALPLVGQAMYVPEIRANSDEVRVTVNDTPR